MRIESDKNQAETGLEQVGFEQLFDAYYDELQHFIFFKSGDTEVAEDIIQDAFLKLWEIRSSVRVDTARALLYTIAANLFSNRYKRMKLNLKLQLTIVEDRTFETPEFEMEIKEFDQKLQRVLSGINENNRTVFLMNRMDQMTYSEIAVNLGISVKAVEKRMKKALEHVRKEIEQKF
ncbi:MAG: sigma-70 family RNA polymerase sigma factor [Bacteroidota bacterium]|nr:RNA polymerase subunit sigma-70 [Odoribacter sp.]MDP3641704.1 sigma-70 family RNA polymerase sigma factor [Bacteroidota bacterium]